MGFIPVPIVKNSLDALSLDANWRHTTLDTCDAAFAKYGYKCDVGIVTGNNTGIMVVEVLESLSVNTFVAMNTTGMMQYVFMLKENTKVMAFDGIDIRVHNGGVVEFTGEIVNETPMIDIPSNVLHTIQQQSVQNKNEGLI